MDNTIFTRRSGWTKLLGSLGTATSFAAPAVTISTYDALPALTGGIDAGYQGIHEHVWTHVGIQFFGRNANDATFSWRLLGWAVDTTRVLWVPQVIMTGTGKLGAMTGIDPAAIGTSDYLADTIVRTGGVDSGYSINSPEDNVSADLLLDFRGFRLLQLQLSIGTATGINAVYRFLA